MKKIFFILVFLFPMMATGEDLSIVRDFSNNATINSLIGKIVSNIESEYHSNINVYNESNFSYKTGSRIVGVGDKSINKILAVDNVNSLDKIFIGNMTPQYQGLSFAYIPSPASVVKEIRAKLPFINNVYMISNDKYSWIDSHYKHHFKEAGIIANIYYAKNFKDAFEYYKSIFGSIDNDKSLILINSNSIVDKEVILPYILRESWDKDVIVVSTKPSHVNRGVLMSFVPDVNQIGAQVVYCLINGCEFINNIEGFNVSAPLVNKRMYSHLNISLEGEFYFVE